MPKEVLAWAYSIYYQIVNEIIKHKVKKDFLFDKGGLNSGCWWQFIMDEDGGGEHYIPVDNDLNNPDSMEVN